jgi:hypothetical protein
MRFSVLELKMSAESDVEFCRRVGEKSDRARPLVVGFFTEWSKSTLLKNCKYLQETEMSHMFIMNDLTEKQRRMEKELINKAERRNVEELTDEDRAKNFVWKVVGRKGQKKIINSLGQDWEVSRRGAAAGRGPGRGQAPRAALGNVNLLPTRKRLAAEQSSCDSTSKRSRQPQETEIRRRCTTEEKRSRNERQIHAKGKRNKRQAGRTDRTGDESHGGGEYRRGGGGTGNQQRGRGPNAGQPAGDPQRADRPDPGNDGGERGGGGGEPGGGDDQVQAGRKLDKTATLKFLYLNAQSIASKIDELLCVAEDLKPDLVFITESWCNDNVTNAYLTIPGYQLAPDLRSDRVDTCSGIGGGLLVHAKHGMNILLVETNVNFNQHVGFKLVTETDTELYSSLSAAKIQS